jgi:hypothetical protein
MKNLPSWMTTVTPASKIIAAILFITLPFVGFFIGTTLARNDLKTTSNKIATFVYTLTPSIAPTVTTIVSTSKAGDPYEGWKSYTSTELDLTFKYPSNWNIRNDIIVQNDKTCPYALSPYPNIKDVKNCKVKNEQIYIENPINKDSISFTYFPPYGRESPPNDVFTTIKRTITISGQKYEMDTLINQTRNEFDLGTVANVVTSIYPNGGVDTGSKSNFRYFFPSFTIKSYDSSNLDIIQKIMESITD